MCSPRPASGRQGMLLPVEGERWQLILTGDPLLRTCLLRSRWMCGFMESVLSHSTPSAPMLKDERVRMDRA